MCIILTDQGLNTPKPDFKYLKECDAQNPDGIGIAYISQGKLNFEKDLNIVDAFQILESLESHWAVHFRFASIGEPSAELCHPFPISESASLDLWGYDTEKRLLMHNGHVENWADILYRLMPPTFPQLPGGAWSDSRAIAYITHFWGETWLNTLIGQRFLIMDESEIRLYGPWVQAKQGWYQSKDLIDRSKKHAAKYEDNTWYDKLNDYIA